MNKRIVPVCLIVFAGMVWPVAEAAVHDRIARKIEKTSSFVVKGSVHPMVQASYDNGRVGPSFRMERITMSFKLTDAQQADLDALLKQQQDPASPNYHKWITPEQFADRFGISVNDLNQVADWLQSQGFTIDEVARNRRSITFTGSAAQVETAFRASIHAYTINGQTFYANVNDPYVPDALADVILGFRSLNNFRMKARARRGHVNDVPDFTSSTTGNHFLAPADFATIYNLNSLYANGLDGSGQRIAIMGQTDINLNDIRAFRSASGLPQNDPEVVLVPGSPDPGTDDGDLGEADLDLEWSGAVARNAHLIYVNSNNGVFDSLQYAIDQNIAPVISVSYGDCEKNDSIQDINMLSALAQQANAQGITILAPSGDSGAADCDYNARIASRGLAVDFPASLPYVTGMGGSEFQDATNSWSPTNNAMNGSALSYISETTWNDTARDVVLSSSGGGRSIYFAKPDWQSVPGVPNDQARDVPDVSFNASADHDGYLVCSLGSCVSGFRAGDGTLSVAGGTSVAPPAFAGIVAILNQAANAPQGNINPALYKLARLAPSAFHDIVTGGNQVACLSATIDCTNGVIGYTAGPGYDQATGLGSVDAFNLITSWHLAVTPVVPTTPPGNVTATIPQPIVVVEQGSTRSGYVIITPDSNSAAPVAAATFGIVNNAIVQSQAAVLPEPMTSSATVPVNVVPGIGRNLGVAIANPGAVTNLVTITLLDANGSNVAATTLTVPGQQQLARFINELFGSSTIGAAFIGSLHLQSSTPFSVLGLRFSGVEFSTVPLIGATSGAVPSRALSDGSTVGGDNALIAPQFALGGGWSSEITLVNNNATTVTGRIDIFDSSGNPMSVTLNNTTQSTFRYSVPAGGTFVLAPRDVNGQTPM